MSVSDRLPDFPWDSLAGAKAVLINVTGGTDMTLLEVDEAANVISDQADPDANIIFGAAFDPSLEGKLRVSVVATGMNSVTPPSSGDTLQSRTADSQEPAAQQASQRRFW